MESDSKGFTAMSVEGFSRLFGATAMSFEWEAQRISKQTLTVALRASRKRSSRK